MSMPLPGGSKPTSTPPTRTGAMLTESQLAVLTDFFPPLTSVREDMSVLQAGYLMGVHAVLNKLRSGV